MKNKKKQWKGITPNTGKGEKKIKKALEENGHTGVEVIWYGHKRQGIDQVFLCRTDQIPETRLKNSAEDSVEMVKGMKANPCGGCRFEEVEKDTIPCCNCKRIVRDYFEQ